MKEEPETAFLRWIGEIRRLSPHTVRAYRDDVAELRAHVDQVAPGAWPAVPVEALRSYLAESVLRGLSRKSIARKLSAVRAFFAHLVDAGVLVANPALRISTPKPEHRLPGFLTQGQTAALFAHAERAAAEGEAFVATRNLAVLELLYGGGLRLAELQALDCGQVDLLTGWARVMGKGQKERTVPIGDSAVRALRRYGELREELLGVDAAEWNAPLFVTSRGGRRLSRRQIQRAIPALLAVVAAEAGLSVHSLRHSFATHLMENGASILAVQELLGHQRLQTTTIYTHVTTTRMMRAYRAAHPRA